MKMREGANVPEKRLICIGGGELKQRETLKIDEYIAALAKERAGDRRACGLFLPTASHDCMPYYNTFHKVYTGTFQIKTDVALIVNRDVDLQKMAQKFQKADFLYVGGGNTVFMIEEWKKSGILPLIRDAYERGVLICGLSAGAICWFEEMYSDSVEEGVYSEWKGLGWVEGKISPHYNERMLDFDRLVLYNKSRAWGVENCSALEVVDGVPTRSISCGGKVWRLDATSGELQKTEF
ncbi:MAG: Type 1 glutamine amidotransferase-like domain-containing protein [Clostridia bacterium]|nr:Type 1 glutamine amidotransferase-like domain-containing protein [Clostridia bacterium]